MINDAYPIHQVEYQLEAMRRSSVFLTLDLTKGYHQMRLAKNSKKTTAFTSPRVISVEGFANGMKTSRSVFQWLIDAIL